MFKLAAANPFLSSYLQADWFGKLIFLALFSLSVLSWTLLSHRAWLFFQIRKRSQYFLTHFSEKEPLDFSIPKPFASFVKVPDPFFEIYKTFKQRTLQIIGRNHLYIPHTQTSLSDSDLNLIESHLQMTLNTQHKLLEKNLFLLSTVASLGPFLGLLGTVWGILLTFSEIHQGASSMNQSAMLSGISMALATTVVGLLIAIPAFAGYNYLKNASREYRKDMDNFSQMLLAAVEYQHYKPDYAKKTTLPE